MGTSSTRYLNKLASLRFFAAFLVVIYHLGIVTNHFDNALQRAYSVIADYGFAGVSIFFVLSGIVISHANDNWKGWKKYLIGRVTRIYPPHLIVTFSLCLLTITALFKNEGITTNSCLIFISNILLLQSWVPDHHFFFSLNIVTWSLSVEMFFYVSFILLRRLKDSYLFALTIISYICITTLVLSTHGSWNFDLHWKLYINPLARLPEFLVGMSIYRLYKNKKLPKLWLPQFNFPILLAAMLAALVTAGELSDMGTSFKESLTYSVIPIPFVALMMIALLDESSNYYMHNKTLVLLGESSFALYLIHKQLIHYAYSLSEKWLSQSGLLTISFMILMATVSISISVIFYKSIELPLTRYLKKLFTNE